MYWKCVPKVPKSLLKVVPKVGPNGDENVNISRLGLLGRPGASEGAFLDRSGSILYVFFDSLG